MPNKEQLIKQIKQKELQIQKLHLHRDDNDVCSKLYNTMILEKAILNKQLQELQMNPIIEKIKKTFSKKEKLICDYFQ